MDSKLTQIKTKEDDQGEIPPAGNLDVNEECGRLETSECTATNIEAATALATGEEESLDWEIRQLENISAVGQSEASQDVCISFGGRSERSQNVDNTIEDSTPEEVTSQTEAHGPLEKVQSIPRGEGVPQPGTSIELPSMPTTEDMDMDCEDASRAQKRKNCHPETDSQGDSEEEVIRPSKLRPRHRRVLLDDEQENDILTGSSQKVSIAAGSDAAPCSTSEVEEERGRKVGRPKKCRRAVDPEEAERKVLEATGVAPEYLSEDLLQTMTASDISAQALEYLGHIEVIRVKSGRLQGSLSGELKKRKMCLEEMIRALQIKAESKSDPEFLKHKLCELMSEIKNHKKEEEKRNREVSELREVINELRKENKEVREELRRMRERVRRVSEEKVENRREEEKEEPPRINKKRYLPEKSYLSRDSSLESRSRSPSAVVMRPPLGGRSIPIQEGLKQRKEERLEIVNRQIEALTKAREKIHRTEETQGEEEIQAVREEMMPPPLPQRRPKIKVLENIQLVPPRTNTEQVEKKEDLVEMKTKDQNEWVRVSKKERKREKRRRKGEALNQPVSGPPLPSSGGKGEGKTGNVGGKKEGTPRRRVPKTAAVCIKGKSDGFSYAEALRKARNNISLSDLQIGSPKIRKGINGATIIEIAGPGNNEKADKLVEKLQEVLEDATITRPTIKGEVRLIGLEESITKEEIEYAIADVGGCSMQEVVVGEIRPTRSGLSTVWLRCPLRSAITIANKGKIPIGWTMVRTELLKARPTQCFRCWKVGHTIRNCKSDMDFGSCCFRCGRKGHIAKFCQNPIHCILCAKLHKNSDHRVGSPQCEGVKVIETLDGAEISERRNEMMNIEIND